MRKFLENRFFFAVRVKMTAKHTRPADDLAAEVAQTSLAYCLAAANHRLVGANYRLAAANHCLVAANEGYAARVRFSAALGGANYLLFDATSRRKA